jgi:hypothetical protein
MKIKILFIVLSVPVLLLFNFCNKENDVDTEYPVIDMSSPDSYPQNCDTINRGKTFTAKATFSDNVELGAYSIDIHENFDHHTHSADIDQCDLDQIKDPVNPFKYIQSFEIPAGSKEYSMSVDIFIPQDVDPGDYHFMIRLTDKAGWQSLYGLSIKVL